MNRSILKEFKITKNKRSKETPSLTPKTLDKGTVWNQNQIKAGWSNLYRIQGHRILSNQNWIVRLLWDSNLFKTKRNEETLTLKPENLDKGTEPWELQTRYLQVWEMGIYRFGWGKWTVEMWSKNKGVESEFVMTCYFCFGGNRCSVHVIFHS